MIRDKWKVPLYSEKACVIPCEVCGECPARDVIVATGSVGVAIFSWTWERQVISCGRCMWKVLARESFLSALFLPLFCIGSAVAIVANLFRSFVAVLRDRYSGKFVKILRASSSDPGEFFVDRSEIEAALKRQRIARAGAQVVVSIVRADGNVLPAEEVFIWEYAGDLLGQETLGEFVFGRGDAGVGAIDTAGFSVDEKTFVLRLGVLAAACDGRIAKEEWDLLCILAGRFELPGQLLTEMREQIELHMREQTESNMRRSGEDATALASALRTLELGEEASHSEAKQAYMRRCLQCHPDKHMHKGNEERARLEEEFKRVAQAWAVVKTRYTDESAA